MIKLTLGRVLCSAAVMAGSVAPSFALDYEAKPVMWVIQSPFRLVGGLTGAAVTGLVSDPIDQSFHWTLKGSQHVAGKFGDENGTGQLIVGVPTGGSVGLVIGGAYGAPHGALGGFKKGWDKPFSRWSYITMEDK